MRSLAPVALVVVAMAALSSSASAQTILSQWNANGTTSATYNGASAGTNQASGTTAGFGQSVPSSPLGSVLMNGTLIDPGTVVTGTTYNRSFTVNPPLISASNTSAGMQFTASTAGMSAGQAVQIQWSQTVGYRSSRYWQILASTSGTGGPFSVVNGTGSLVSQFVNGYNSGTNAISGTATVNVSNTGLVDFRTISGNWISQSVTTTGTVTSPLLAGFVDNITFTFPTGQGFENNPNFAVAIVGAWDPSLSATSGTTGLLSSFAGTDSTDLVSGYNRSIASGGSMRIDLFTIQSVAAVPEPTMNLMLGSAAVLGGSVAWRRRSRRARNA